MIEIVYLFYKRVNTSREYKMNIKSLTIKSTVILELEVMTELTEDEFYDNGNIAENIAALLGINPKKIKIMDVVRFVIFSSQIQSGWSEGENCRII